MPSPRKRIGFLPCKEVQKIIDKICLEESLSQSKVTGLLVEEALQARGIFNNSQLIQSSIEKNDFNYKSNILANGTLKIKKSESQSSDSEKEIELLRDFLEFKRFKMLLKEII